MQEHLPECILCNNNGTASYCVVIVLVFVRVFPEVDSETGLQGQVVYLGCGGQQGRETGKGSQSVKGDL